MKRLIEFYLPSGEYCPKFCRCIIKRSSPNTAMYPRVGILWNWRAGWIGWHHSPQHMRLCVNVLPFLTIWYTKPGGMLP